MFRIRNLNFAYPNQPALFKDLQAEFYLKQNTLIQGENGCGKSSLLKLLVGDLKAQSGSISLTPDKAWFYVPQDAQSRILGLTIEQDLRLWQIAGLQLSLDQLANLPLLRGFDPELFQLPLRELSTGTKQAYVLSLALLHSNSYLILDEALPGLDEQRRTIFSSELSRHKGILAVSHDAFSEPDIFDHTLILQNGGLF